MNDWHKFFAWLPVRMGRKWAWLCTLERAKSYFVPLNDDPYPPGPSWVYRYPRK